MIITRTSIVSGITRSIDIPMTEEQWKRYCDNSSNELIQDIFPELDDNQREFILTGVTAEEWDSMMGGFEEYYEDDEPAF